jgi:hypothetical protein
MLIYVKKKTFYGQTDGQPKTIVRNLTKKEKKIFFPKMKKKKNLKK